MGIPEGVAVHPGITILVGLVAIVGGAEVLLRGATRVASMLGVKPILIGLTVVAIGTSAPEIAVCITAALEGNGTLAVANIAGTNIVNILLILGLSAAIRAMPLELLTIRLDGPVMAASALALVGFAADGTLDRLDGALLSLGAVAYTAALVKLSKRESPRVREEFEEEFGPEVVIQRKGVAAWITSAAMLAAGIAGTVGGAHLLVEGAASAARALGVSDAIVGLTIVAIGTSAPELATTIVATVRDDRDVAIGNLIGSSISNILVVLGVTCLVAPEPGVDVSDELLRFDLPLGAAVALVCLPVFYTGRRISRGEGVAFVLAYAVYFGTLVALRA